MNKLRKNMFEGMGRVPYFDTIGKNDPTLVSFEKTEKFGLEGATYARFYKDNY